MANRAASFPADQAPAQVILDDGAVLLSKLGHRAKRMFTQRLEPLALKANHVQVLVYLSGHPGASQRSLVEALRVTPSTVVELIDDLEARAFVRRLRNPANRRASVVSLTADGRSMLERALALSHVVEHELLAPLPARDRERLVGYLQALDAATHDAGRPVPPVPGTEAEETAADGPAGPPALERVPAPASMSALVGPGGPGAPGGLRAPGSPGGPGAPGSPGGPGARGSVGGPSVPGGPAGVAGVAAVAAVRAAGSASKADWAYETLRQWIAEGVYQPGDRLVLQQIARDLQISTVPVREAIRRLEAEGFADFQRNVGARVSSVDTPLYAESMRTLAILEGAATGLAAAHLTKRDIQTAERINDRMGAGLRKLDPAKFTQANRAFHELLCRPCPNTHLLALIDVEWSRLAAIRISTFAFVPERAAQAVEEHRHLLARLRAGAPAPEIESLIRDHRMATVHAFLERHDERARPPA